MKYSIKELRDLYKSKKALPSEIVMQSLQAAHHAQGVTNSFVTILDEAVEEARKYDNQSVDKILQGVPGAIKDNFCTKDILTTASSTILEDFVPFYDATCVEKLKEHGYINLGKTALDEFAMGGSSLTSYKGYVCNPHDPSRIAGGSSGGSAVVVTEGAVPFALGSDTGDSIRRPASYCGIVGIKPTWGRVSRYGVIAFAPSLDTVGPFARTVDDCALILELISGHDPKDATCSSKPIERYRENLKTDLTGIKLAILKPLIEASSNQGILDRFFETVEVLKQNGATVDMIDFDEKLLRAITPLYMTISNAEAVMSLACMDGVKYGKTENVGSFEANMMKLRTESFNFRMRNRLVKGSYALETGLYLKAKKVRHALVNEITKVLEQYDAYISPTTDEVAPTIAQVEERIPTGKVDLSDPKRIVEDHLQLANFAGLPSISVPMGLLDNLPIGFSITGGLWKEQLILNVANTVEDHYEIFKNIVAEV